MKSIVNDYGIMLLWVLMIVVGSFIGCIASILLIEFILNITSFYR